MTMSDTTYPASFSEVINVTGDLPNVDPQAELACNWGDAQDCADDNALRAEFAAVGVKAFAKRTGVLDEEPETAISDLLGDLMHLCDALGLNFDGLVESGRQHYDLELRGEF